MVNPMYWFCLISNRLTRTSCISMSVRNRNCMAKPIPLTTWMIRCVSHHDMGKVLESSTIFNRDRAIAVPMLGASCRIMFVIRIMFWSRSAGSSDFVIVIKVVNSSSVTAVPSPTSISTPSVSLVAQFVWVNAVLISKHAYSKHAVSMLQVLAWLRFAILQKFVGDLFVWVVLIVVVDADHLYLCECLSAM